MNNSFNFIVVKDMHLMYGFRNSIRKHGWEADIDRKLDQIINYAKDNNIKHIFTTGDVFEKSNTKRWSFNQFQENKKRLLKFKNAGLILHSNAGNHDFWFGKEDIHGTVFGEMVELGLIHYIGGNQSAHSFMAEEPNPNFVNVFGIDHHQSIDVVIDKLGVFNARIQNYKECLKNGECSPAVHLLLMHSNVTDQQTRLTDFTYNQLAEYDFDVILCGHWHLEPEGGAIQKVNGTYFINPWNLTRVARDYNVKLDEHKPSMIHGSVVWVGDEPQFNFKEIQIEHKPFSEAFNVDVINLLQELSKDGFNFFKEVNLEQDEDLNDDASLLEAIAKAHEIGAESVTIAKELLT